MDAIQPDIVSPRLAQRASVSFRQKRHALKKGSIPSNKWAKTLDIGILSWGFYPCHPLTIPLHNSI
jgi:hypothetical protein